jgi:hypothetical protein
MGSDNSAALREVPMTMSLTITLAMLAVLTFINPRIGRAQTKKRAKLIEDAKK